ncbi:MAG: hypothetical protein FWD73_02940 [Polyangiaceae bacterium]|nr:hypothetical protein [Polyangiaceae bacterium]
MKMDLGRECKSWQATQDRGFVHRDAQQVCARILVIAAITLAACSHRAESTSTVATSPPPSADVAPTPPTPSVEPLASASTQSPQAAEEPPFDVPPGTSRIASTFCYHHGVTAAPGKPASPSLPAGSVYIGCIAIRPSNNNQLGSVPTVIEWDVAGGRVLRSVDLPLNLKTADDVRIATFHDNVYVALTTGIRDETLLFALDADLRPRETRSLGISTNVSLEVNEKYLAVSYRPFIDDTWWHPIKIELFNANNFTAIATTSVGTAELFWSSGYALEFLGDRLYVAGVPDDAISRGKYMPSNVPFVGVFAMSLPSLEIVHTYKNAKNSYIETTLQSAAGHIILTGEEGYEELTADLKPIRNHKGSYYALAFDPKTGRAFSCRDLNTGSACCCGGICSCYTFWTGFEAAVVANINWRLVIGRVKDLPRRKR